MMRKCSISDRATSLNLNNSNIGHSVVNLWMLRLLCNGDLWAKVARNDMYSHDALPKFFWGLKLRRHLHLGALILNNEKFFKTGAVKDIKAVTDVEMELDEDAVIAPEKRIRYLIEEVWRQYNFIDGLMPFLTVQPVIRRPSAHTAALFSAIRLPPSCWKTACRVP